MLLDMKRDQILPPSGVGTITAEEPSAAEMFAYATGVARRQIFVVLLFALLGAGLGAVFFIKSVHTYTAT